MPVSPLLVAVLLSAAPDAGAAPPFSWDVPGQLTLVRAGKTLDSGGLPIVVFAARSKWKLRDLLTHYARRFADAGFYLPKAVRMPGFDAPRVVALDPMTMVSFLVYGWAEPDGTTTLMLGAADLGHRKPATQSGLPVFPAATHVTTFNVEQGTAVSFNAKGTEAEVLDFYRSVLPTGGWREREAGIFVRESRAVKVLTKSQGAELSVMVLESYDDGAANVLEGSAPP